MRLAGTWLTMAAVAVWLGGCSYGEPFSGPPITYLVGPDLSRRETLGMVGTTLSSHPFRVRAERGGQPLSGLEIVWEVTGDGASIFPARDVTREGNSTAVVTLGPNEGRYTVTATAPTLPGAPQKVIFTATAVTEMVQVRDLADGGFVPSNVTVPVGRSVGWVYASGEGDVHNVIFEDDPTQPTSSADLWESAPGRLYHSRQFSGPPRTVRYRCTYHSASFTEGEVGAVFVTEPLESKAVR